MCPNFIQNVSNIYPKCVQSSSKFYQNCVKIPSNFRPNFIQTLWENLLLVEEDLLFLQEEYLILLLQEEYLILLQEEYLILLQGEDLLLLLQEEYLLLLQEEYLLLVQEEYLILLQVSSVPCPPVPLSTPPVKPESSNLTIKQLAGHFLEYVFNLVISVSVYMRVDSFDILCLCFICVLMGVICVLTRV